MPLIPHPKIRLPKLKLRLPRPNFRRFQAGALWALVALAALATLPSLAPGSSQGQALGEDNQISARDEAAARYQAWLRGRAAGQDPSAAAAAAQQAANGPGAAVPTPTIVTPTAGDNDIPAMALQAYHDGESWAEGFDPNCKLSWSVLAGIGRIESNHGRHFGAQTRFSSSGDVTPTILGPVLNGAPNTGTIHDTDGGRLDGDAVWDRAVGPMQFIPSTWQSLGRDGNGDQIANPNNLFDAAVSAAGYLCQSGGGTLADEANLRRAIFAYNHSLAYVQAVISWANFYLKHAGQGSLVEVQVPTGPSSSVQPGVAAGGTGVALGGTGGASGGTGGAAGGTGGVTGGAGGAAGGTGGATGAAGGGTGGGGGATSPGGSQATGGSSGSSTTRTAGTQGPPPSTSTGSSQPTTSSSVVTLPTTTTTTQPPPTTPCATTTTTSSTDSTTTTTTTTTDPSATTSTTLPPCPPGQGEQDGSDQTTSTAQ